MKLRNVLFLAVAGTAVAVFARSRTRHADHRAAGASASSEDRPCSTHSLDATPVIVIRAARLAVTVGPSSTDRLEIRSSGTRADVDIEVGEGGERELTLDCARGVLEVGVPKRSALRLECSRCAAKIVGLDNVDVSCTRGSVTMKGVAGVVAVNSTRGSVRVSLAADRPIHSLAVDATRSACAIVLPAGRGGDYDVQESRSSVRHPSPIEGGIPMTLHASRASVEIHGNERQWTTCSRK